MFNPRFGGSFKDRHTSSLAALMNLSATRDSTSKKYGGDQPGQSILTVDLHIEAHKYVSICIHSSTMNIYQTCTHWSTTPIWLADSVPSLMIFFCFHRNWEVCFKDYITEISIANMSGERRKLYALWFQSSKLTTKYITDTVRLSWGQRCS